MATTTKKTISADSSNPFHTLVNLWPYMWPSDRPDLKMRVVWASVFLLASKIVLLLVPYFFKWATDALNDKPDAVSLLPTFLLGAVMLVFAYNGARIVQAGLNQLRDALFASVGQYAVRQLAYRTFVHLHRLSLRFHLERRTGGLSRVIERGTKGIETIVRFTILNSVPTFIEFLLTAVVFWRGYGLQYLLVTAATVWLYIWFTVKASDWRISIRRSMNDSDTEANTKAIDSLLNFETVKYFGNEEMEARRFDQSMERYEKAATQVWTSLGWLNFGQALIFGLGMAVMMAMSAMAVQRGDQSVGDFVFINAMLIQLAIPLNFIGFVYREIRQGLTDIEQMFELLEVEAEVQDKPDARELVVTDGAISFKDVHFAYDPARPILKGITFDVPAGKTVAVVGPSGAGKSTLSRLLYRFYDVQEGTITIDGQDVRDVTQKSLRKVIGMVPQDTVLFNDTIAYNIRYGRPGATDEEVAAAAEAAQIHALKAGTKVLAVSDARRREVYYALYTVGELTAQGVPEVTVVEGPEVASAADLIETGLARGAVVVGEGAALYAEAFAGADVRSAPAVPSTTVLAQLALARRGAGVDQPTTPLYLRRPDAQVPGARKRALG